MTNTGAKANSYSAWLAGTGSFANSNGTADPGDPTKIPGTVVNPDNQCVLNSTIAANPNGAALVAKGSLVPTAPGPNTHVVDGTGTAQNLQFGISSGGVGGALTPTTKQQPGSQGACIAFFGGNSTNFYMSPVGKFTTPKLGTRRVRREGRRQRRQGSRHGQRQERLQGSGTLELTTKKDKKTITDGQRQDLGAAERKTTVGVKLTSAGTKALQVGQGWSVDDGEVRLDDRPADIRQQDQAHQQVVEPDLVQHWGRPVRAAPSSSAQAAAAAELSRTGR